VKTRSAKNKGARLQKWVAEKISKLLGIPCGKDELISSREMGQSGTDVRLIGRAKKLFSYSCECKNCESWSFPKWIKQTKANQEKGTDWLLVVKNNHHEPIVVMDAEVFFKLQSKLIKLKEKSKRGKK
jgi:hypothetical protein